MVYANDTTQFDTDSEAPKADTAKAKPCIALMGEFSAGKSTLCNLILGEPALPTRVTATRLPPIWVAQGNAPAQRVNKDGSTEALDFEQIDQLPVEGTSYVKVNKAADLLNLCDLIDMPGISDPNMADLDWGDILDQADAVIWCTHATQAWRQSEAAAWNALPEKLKSKSMLLLTRFDKLTSDRDRKRVVLRIEKETAGMFRGVFPISLTAAMDAGDDPDLLRASGAEDFARGIVDLLSDMDAIDPAAPASV